jgi:hypothetical protein
MIAELQLMLRRIASMNSSQGIPIVMLAGTPFPAIASSAEH